MTSSNSALTVVSEISVEEMGMKTEDTLALVRPNLPKENNPMFTSEKTKEEVIVLMSEKTLISYVDSEGTKSGVIMRNITSNDLKKLIEGTLPTPTIEVAADMESAWNLFEDGVTVYLQDVLEFRNKFLIPALNKEFPNLESNKEIEFRYHQDNFKATQLIKWVGQKKVWCILENNKMQGIFSHSISNLDIAKPTPETKDDFFFVNLSFEGDHSTQYKPYWVRTLISKYNVRYIQGNKIPCLLVTKLDSSGSAIKDKSRNSIIFNGKEMIGNAFNAIITFLKFDEKSTELETLIKDWKVENPKAFEWTPKYVNKQASFVVESPKNVESVEEDMGYDDLINHQPANSDGFYIIFNGKKEEHFLSDETQSVWDALVGYFYYEVFQKGGWKKLKNQIYVHINNCVYIITKQDLETNCEFFKDVESQEEPKEAVSKVTDEAYQILLNQLEEKHEIILGLLDEIDELRDKLTVFETQELINKYKQVDKLTVSEFLDKLDENDYQLLELLKTYPILFFDGEGNFLSEDSDSLTQICKSEKETTNFRKFKARIMNFMLDDSKDYLEQSFICFNQD